MNPVARIVADALKLPIHLYRLMLSPWLGANCRFQPTCSAYALEALSVHGPIRGSWLAARRLLSCHPVRWLGGRSGFDPVPPPCPGGDVTHLHSPPPATSCHNGAAPRLPADHRSKAPS